MARIDKTYKALSEAIIERGYFYNDKKRDIVCKQISSVQINVDIKNSFPLLTTKKMFTKGIIVELLWFLKGMDNIKYLNDHDVHIWDKDAYNWYLNNSFGDDKKDYTTFLDYIKEGIEYDEEVKDHYSFGDVGRNYGVQWRNWSDYIISELGASGDITNRYFRNPIDQLKELIINLINNPMSRRHIVTAWNPSEINDTALPPCHWSFEIIPRPLSIYERVSLLGNKEIEAHYEEALMSSDSEKDMKEILKDLEDLNVPEYGFTLKWHQRSVDTFLGLPFNIASYALLAKIIEGLTGYIAYELIGDLSNVHFYRPHIEKVKEQLSRSTDMYPDAQLEMSPELIESFDNFRKGNISFDDLIDSLEPKMFSFKYESYSAINADMYSVKN